jgi:hypothetical protein
MIYEGVEVTGHSVYHDGKQMVGDVWKFGEVSRIVMVFRRIFYNFSKADAELLLREAFNEEPEAKRKMEAHT